MSDRRVTTVSRVVGEQKRWWLCIDKEECGLSRESESSFDEILRWLNEGGLADLERIAKGYVIGEECDGR